MLRPTYPVPATAIRMDFKFQILDFRFMILDVFFYAAEVHVELVEMLQQYAKRGALGHFGKRIHILREALATIAELTVGTRNIGMRVVDIT